MTTPPGDPYLAERIRTAIAQDARVNELGIAVTIVGDRVFVTGTVPTAERRDGIGEPSRPYVSIRRAGQEEEFDGTWDSPIDLPPGTYDITVSYAVPLVHRGLIVEAGHETTVRCEGFGRLVVNRTDGQGNSPRVDVLRPGTDEVHGRVYNEKVNDRGKPETPQPVDDEASGTLAGEGGRGEPPGHVEHEAHPEQQAGGKDPRQDRPGDLTGGSLLVPPPDVEGVDHTDVRTDDADDDREAQVVDPGFAAC